MAGFSYELSAQATLECTSFYAPDKRVSDCSGGYFPDPLTFYGKVGGVLLSSYPYISGSYGSGTGYPHSTGICTETNRIYLGAGTNYLQSGLTATQIKTMLVTYGPVMVGIYADSGFNSYGGGTYSGCPANAANNINHAVLLYGWDSNGNWLILN
jgi:C1A family cysteine protease